MKLYKYYPVSANAILGITGGYVWYSSPHSFNDPFDTRIIGTDLLQKISFSVEKILCLSAVNDNLLMWAHYADGHRGFCAEFTDYSDEELHELKERGIFPQDAPHERLTTIRGAKPVSYKTSAEIEVLINDIPLEDETFLRHYNELDPAARQELVKRIQETTFVKHIDWQHEQEYRIVNIDKNMMCFPGKLTAIYFGMEMPSISKRAIGKSIDQELKGACSFYQMHREKGRYSLSCRKFDAHVDLPDLGLSFK